MPITLLPHDPRWEDLYGTIATGLRTALGSVALSVDHVGSTAIPGILAKPVIDVLVLVERYDPEASYREPLASLGYAFDHRDETHAFFTGSLDGTAVHVHIVEEGDEAARDMLVFRDVLRSHRPTAHRDEALKVSLAARLDEPVAYGAEKTAFVRDIVGRAGAGVDP